MKLTPYTLRSELPDTWSPFIIDKVGGETYINPVAITSDTPYAGVAYTDNGRYVTEHDSINWSVVQGLAPDGTERNVLASNETLEPFTLVGLESGIYQCVLVDMLNCDDCEDTCDCDRSAGWAVVKLND